jgi:hypothetical protein
MNAAVSDLLEQARQLPVSQRAELAAEILSTMDGEPDPGADRAWVIEIARRAKRAVDGVSQGEDWEAVHAELLAELSQGCAPSGCGTRASGDGRVGCADLCEREAHRRP